MQILAMLAIFYGFIHFCTKRAVETYDRYGEQPGKDFAIERIHYWM